MKSTHRKHNDIQFYSSNTHAQLNLGCLVGQQGNFRECFFGSGFALNSDAYGAITTQKGLYISTYGRPGGRVSQLDAREAHDQLIQAQELTQNLGRIGKVNVEALPGRDAFKEFIDATQAKYDDAGQQEANRFAEPLLLASPAGIGLSTPKRTHIHSSEHITMSSGEDINLVTLPLKLTRVQIDILVEAGVPDQLLSMVMENQPQLLSDLPTSEHYRTMQQHLFGACQLKLYGMRDIFNYTCAALIYGAWFESDPTIAALLEQVKAGTISF